MPTTIHSTGHVKRGSSSDAELQNLLVCLGLVCAVILTSFGLSKLVGLLHIRRRAGSTKHSLRPPKIRCLNGPPSLYTLPATPHPAPSIFDSSTSTTLVALFPWKAAARPQDPRAGVIDYIKASPYLQHISAPRSYALRHRRRLCFTHPGPTPLRNVISATPHGKRFSSMATVGIVTQKSPTTRVLQQNIQTHFRTNDPLERPAQVVFAPHPHSLHATAATIAIEIPVCLAVDSAGDVWSSVERLHATADSVVGAYPGAFPLRERTVPATLQTSFLWAAGEANFIFGLVRSNNAAFGVRSPVKPFAHCLVHRSPLSDSGNANANVKNILSVSANDYKANVARKMDSGKREKENVVAVC
ncbi:hypothetical protein MVEN_01310100 [Mycena venus]|uniref:Uncharacterized protein n=1 Tax=Mycena venus TaxID=2733690 RepID=A0A8H7CVV2_9AGAR|nr:hypothetical protein MVEN_01310100 [Mycena venus]